MKRLLLVALLVLTAGGCKKDIHLRALPSVSGGGKADLRVVLTYDRNNVLTVTLTSVHDGRYVVWTVPQGGDHTNDAVNVGQIRVEGGKGKIATLTPLRKFTLFITTEEKGDARKPGPNVVFQTEKDIDW